MYFVCFLSDSSFCNGRNDLSQFFDQTMTRSTSMETLSISSPKIVNGQRSLFNIDWNQFGAFLLTYNESDMCQQNFTVGSGQIMQSIMINRSCRCAIFEKLFRSNKLLQTFSTLLRPILYGKIYYYPSNYHYDRLIKQLNRTFESFDEIIRLVRPITSLLQSTNTTLNLLCQTIARRSPLCSQMSLYQMSINYGTIIVEFLACSERNRFIPMNSETDIVREGQRQSLTNNFLAAIIFLDNIPNNQSLPKHVRYKIRMSLDYVDSTFRTEDR
jgi:hypothetical protein